MPKDRYLHIYEMAEAQEKDPVISWFVEQVVEPVKQGKHARVRIQEDMYARVAEKKKSHKDKSR